MSNFHATDRVGRDFKTKKALREAVAGNAEVWVADTSMFSNRGSFPISGPIELPIQQLNPSDVIVGPDPYRQRNWYANVKNGKVV